MNVANSETVAFVSPDNVESHLTSELHNMSMEARSKLFEEIHGVMSLPPEEISEHLRKECLHQMAVELDRIPNKRAYDDALNLGGVSSYVNNESYRLSFLRADEFNPQKAAARMVLKLELLSQYFGPAALQRRLTIYDLTEEAQAIVKSGNLQLSPTRDRAGRMIMVRIGSLGAGVSSHTRMTALLFLSQHLTDDCGHEKKGVVIVFFSTSTFDKNSIADPEARRDLRAIISSSAVRPSAIHICLPDTAFHRLIGVLFKVVFPSHLAIRIRIHNGSVTECQYKLMGYGIPGDQLPIKSSELIKTQNHLKWIRYCMVKDDCLMMGTGYIGPQQQQQHQQQIREPFLAIYSPLPSDVLAGRGPPLNHHSGNITYRAILESKLERYDKAKTTEEKFHITFEVVTAVGSVGGRFLTRDPTNDWWVPITDPEVARLKVSVAFRDLRKVYNKVKFKRTKTKGAVGSATLPDPIS